MARKLSAACAAGRGVSSHAEDFLLFHRGAQQGFFHRLKHLFQTEEPAVQAASAASDEDCALDIRNLSFAYAGAPVLHDVSLRVRPGQICGLLGPTAAASPRFSAAAWAFFIPRRDRSTSRA